MKSILLVILIFLNNNLFSSENLIKRVKESSIKISKQSSINEKHYDFAWSGISKESKIKACQNVLQDEIRNYSFELDNEFTQHLRKILKNFNDNNADAELEALDMHFGKNDSYIPNFGSDAGKEVQVTDQIEKYFKLTFIANEIYEKATGKELSDQSQWECVIQ